MTAKWRALPSSASPARATRNSALWIEASVAFPNSLVDRITPSVSAEDAARLNAASGLDDRIPLVAEDFTQWVIEDRFVDGRPTLDSGRPVQRRSETVGTGEGAQPAPVHRWTQA
jgi:mannitol-1-phosphate/altronate dehydrogenase